MTNNTEVNDAIWITFFDLFDKYDSIKNNNTNRIKLINDVNFGIINRLSYEVDELNIKCDLENNNFYIMEMGLIAVDVTYKCERNNYNTYNLLFGNSNVISMPDRYNVYIRRRKIKKLLRHD